MKKLLKRTPRAQEAALKQGGTILGAGAISAWASSGSDTWENLGGVVGHGLAHLAQGFQAARQLGTAVKLRLQGKKQAASAQLQQAKKTGQSSLSHAAKAAVAAVPGLDVAPEKKKLIRKIAGKLQ